MAPHAAPEPFRIDIADSVLDDLQQRLALTRWPDDVPGSEWQYGTSLAYTKELVAYWQNDYDWRVQERLLNSFPQYRVGLDGVTLHYIHQPGVGPDPMPLLISHGWPGSIYEFVNVIGPLTDPETLRRRPAGRLHRGGAVAAGVRLFRTSRTSVD